MNSCRGGYLYGSNPILEVTVLGFIITMLIIGLVAGFLARAIVPGRDAMGIGATIVLGIIGSFVGGFLGWVLFGKDGDEGALQPSGLIGAVLGAIIALLVWRRVGNNNHARV
ncbi:MAG TPA: GlsB/YeaQ/YmgE family stress response membrane protein [Mycobacteriales bacterium]|nr:GlsB/YeaQ/YmgE family stress response membrane protein [Mycobacteriales bacterium]